MGRYYKLSKSISQENADRIKEEMDQLEHVNKAVFDEELAGVIVFADPDYYPQIMDRAVNIFSKEGGAELSFQHFVEDEA